MQTTQSRCAITQTRRRFALSFATTLALSIHAGEVFKWTDSAGKVHYGDNPAGATQASKVEIAPAPASAPDQNTAAPKTQSSSSNGGYSDTLRNCLANGGTMPDCVNMASIAQANQASTEREQAERARTLDEMNQRRLQMYQPSTDSTTQTATNAAALAADRARLRRERQDRRDRESQ